MQLSEEELRLFSLPEDNFPYKDQSNFENLFDVLHLPLWDKDDSGRYYEDKDELRYK